jgi:hypothetical protein
MDVNRWDKSLLFLLAPTVTSTNGFYSLPPLSKSVLKLVCNVNICMYTETSSLENFQDYAQKPQQNCTFMNMASGGKSLGGEYAEMPSLDV